MSEPDIVLQETSPHGNLEAIIEQDDRVAHFYLRSPTCDDFGFKSCWIRNLAPAPAELDAEGLRSGISPMLPREFCLFPEGQTPLDPSRLRLVWFPENDGAALLEDNEMIAAIPSWAGEKGFEGYARDCIGQSSLCWKLEDPTIFNDRIAAADRYWNAWDEKEGPWPNCQDAFLAAYENALGPHSRYFAIDGDNWPPKALIRIDTKSHSYLLTLGISLCPQPAIEMHYDDPSDYRRFEFAACFSKEISDETIMAFASYLSAQSTLPWKQFTFFGHGHTVQCNTFSSDPVLSAFSSVILVNSPTNAPEINTPRIDGEKVSLLWTVPITAEEQQLAEKYGSQELLKKFPEMNFPHTIGARRKV